MAFKPRTKTDASKQMVQARSKPSNRRCRSLYKDGFSKTYTYGMIKSVETGDDGNVRHVSGEYKNPNKNVKRVTSRSVRSLVLVYAIDDLDLFKELF